MERMSLNQMRISRCREWCGRSIFKIFRAVFRQVQAGDRSVGLENIVGGGARIFDSRGYIALMEALLERLASFALHALAGGSVARFEIADAGGKRNAFGIVHGGKRIVC